MTTEEEIVIEKLKDWFLLHNAAYLAKESAVVHWGKSQSVTDDDVWIIWTIREAINIFKATILPFGLMKYCTTETIMTAALEVDRSFISGVNSDVQCLPQYFNFNREALRVEVKDLDYSLELMTRIIRNIEKITINVLIKDVGRIFDECYIQLGLAPVSGVKRNTLMRSVINQKSCLLTEKNYSNRYMYNGRVHAVLRHKLAIGVEPLTDEEVAEHSFAALKGSVAAQRFAKGEQRILLGVSI